MKDLIEAFKIFEKYIPDKEYPTWCEHDVLGVLCPKDKMTREDRERLSELSFHWSYEDESFYSYKYGS